MNGKHGGSGLVPYYCQHSSDYSRLTNQSTNIFPVAKVQWNFQFDMASNWCDTATIQWIGFIRNKYRKECMTRVEWLEFLHPNPMLQLDLLPFCHLVMHIPHDILLSSMARPPFHFPANSFYSRRLVPFFTDRGKFYFF